jgi:hypothetical protein
MSADGLERLRDLVLEDPALQQRLVALTDEDEFIASTIDLAGASGLDVDADDVRKAFLDGDRRWIERWV